ncbi:MBL fold metallo-hydrolase [Halorarum salinum]|uniref:MBL fold metallo-hydrolase n=1 Tax=Halorarum salinum TaxID=2743089 RepID=A0A7D5LB45_9EURY|nr:MBL fold metallo-hydrolase [Halobaculum salinum]QLG62330.1 MBL fold metallo-hydrolase [Halobaculum salinum]
MTVRHDSLRVEWLGYATVRIETESGFVVYLDPGRYGVLSDYPKDGDLVCVTHDHHYDGDGIERVAARDATVVAFEGVDASRIGRDVVPVGELDREVVRVGEEDHLSVGGVDLWTVPAYNDPEGPHARADGSVSHPRGLGVGYRLAIDGVSVFWPGDGDAHDAYAELDVSLFLANVGGGPVSDRHEAADLAERMDPDLVLPVHYDTIEMLEADSAAFAADVAGRGIPVVLDERGVGQ